MNPNQEQATVFARWIITSFGGGIGGFVVGKGWVSAATMATILSDPLTLLALSGLVSLGWGLWNKTQKNIIASAAAVEIPPAPGLAPQPVQINIPDQKMANEMPANVKGPMDSK